MERIHNLNRYQKALLIILIVMALVFGVVYHIVSSRVGYLYENTILLPSEQGGDRLYSGTIDGRACTFTVAADGTVTLRHGDRVYGPYTVKEDPTAKPEDEPYMTGVEILDGDNVFFRGGYIENGGDKENLVLIDENGEMTSLAVSISFADGNSYDSSGNIVERGGPSATTVLHLWLEPELVNKANWAFWFGGILVSMLTVVCMVFADDLFRL